MYFVRITLKTTAVLFQFITACGWGWLCSSIVPVIFLQFRIMVVMSLCAHQTQIMLQKEPDDRPTAEYIQVTKLPQVRVCQYSCHVVTMTTYYTQLMERYMQDEGEEDTTAATHAKYVC